MIRYLRSPHGSRQAGVSSLRADLLQQQVDGRLPATPRATAVWPMPPVQEAVYGWMVSLPQPAPTQTPPAPEAIRAMSSHSALPQPWRS